MTREGLEQYETANSLHAAFVLAPDIPVTVPQLLVRKSQYLSMTTTSIYIPINGIQSWSTIISLNLSILY